MARSKEFDQEAALRAAIDVFREHGFAASSTDVLLKAMGISRQSLYDTFGDKRSLYLACLQRYNADSVGALLRVAHAQPDPMAGLQAALLHFAGRPAGQLRQGCLGVGATCEFGLADDDVAQANAVSGHMLTSAFEALLVRAKAQGAADAALKPDVGASYLVAMLSGMKVAARGGASTVVLKEMAVLALRGLRA